MENVAISHLEIENTRLWKAVRLCFAENKMAAGLHVVCLCVTSRFEHVLTWSFIETAHEYWMWWSVFNIIKLSLLIRY